LPYSFPSAFTFNSDGLEAGVLFALKEEALLGLFALKEEALLGLFALKEEALIGLIAFKEENVGDDEVYVLLFTKVLEAGTRLGLVASLGIACLLTGGVENLLGFDTSIGAAMMEPSNRIV
jgi:hypothetical protein